MKKLTKKQWIILSSVIAGVVIAVVTTVLCVLLLGKKTPPCEHLWGEWEPKTEATCSSAGERVRKCTKNVAHTEKQPIPIDKDKHDYQWQITKQADYGIDGEQKEICSYNAAHFRGFARIPALITKNLSYRLINEDTEYAVSKGAANTNNATISIPAVYEGKPVTAIDANGFSNCAITGVNIPDSVTSIGHEAFKDCSGLTSVTIGSGVTSIEYDAFYACDGLTSVHITDIAKWCAINFNENITANPLIYAHNLYLNGELVTDLVIPDGVTDIGRGAFLGYSRLTSITIGNSVTSIGNNAFLSCRGLTNVTIPDNVTSIGERAFDGCNGLTSITIGNSVTDIGRGAFGCNGLTSVHITDIAKWCAIRFGGHDANPLYYAHELYLNGDLVTDLVIPDGVTDIGGFAFAGCSGLTSVIIPDNVTSIGENAFAGCSGLTSVTISDNVTSIGFCTFTGCSGLTSVTIPDNVTSIGKSAFYGCSGLTSITIPDGVTSIGNNAFNGCSGLTSVTIGSSVTIIREEAFKGCSSLTSVIIPDNVTSIGERAFTDCGELTSVYITDIAKWCAIQFGDSSGFARNLYLNGMLVTDLVIPKGVTSIGIAFSVCDSLTSIMIPDSVTNIWDSAFPDRGNLTSITVDANNPNYTSQDGILYNKAKTEIIHVPNAISGAVTIPDSMTSIGFGTFSGCSRLTSVTIPDSVTRIREYAFSGCRNLATVYYGGTDSMSWYNIITGEKNGNLMSANRYYYSETEPTESGNYWRWVDGVPTIWA